jgi:hypothetical protein
MARKPARAAVDKLPVYDLKHLRRIWGKLGKSRQALMREIARAEQLPMRPAGRPFFPDQGLLMAAGILCGQAIASGVPDKLVKNVLREWVARRVKLWKELKKHTEQYTGSDAFYIGKNVNAITNRLWEKLAALPEHELDVIAEIVNAQIVKPRQP